MKNIWFVRMDLDTNPWNFDSNNPYICSLHGSCINRSILNKIKTRIFPKSILNKYEIVSMVRKIKDEEGITDKAMCDLVIAYWISIMNEGDIVFVRSQSNEVYIGFLDGYLIESNYVKYGIFSRPVRILKKVEEKEIDPKIFKRTHGRRPIERNARNEINILVSEYIENIDKQSV